MSYAQVAQHHKENVQKEKLKEKQNVDQPQQQNSKTNSNSVSTNSISNRVQPESRENNRGKHSKIYLIIILHFRLMFFRI